MTLSERVHRTSSRRNRDRQQHAEKRLDEIVSVASIDDAYTGVDRAGDLAVEDKLARLYQLMDDPDEKEACVDLAVVWTRSERNEDRVVHAAVDDSVTLLKRNNIVWLSDEGPDAA